VKGEIEMRNAECKNLKPTCISNVDGFKRIQGKKQMFLLKPGNLESWNPEILI
jgi:hypothetical protein